MPTWVAVTRRYGVALEHALATGRLERAGGGARIPASYRFVADEIIAWIEAESERFEFDRCAHRFITSVACHNPHSQVV